MHLSNIKACVFDTFGTVLDWRGSVSRQVAEVAKTKGVDGDWEDAEEFGLPLSDQEKTSLLRASRRSRC